ncbi:MAG TPA: HRDC domain-containing protein [Chthoniobacterales bacterium]|nr:HRDC domain-containing protein [Chthoniobacterales bacterium]
MQKTLEVVKPIETAAQFHDLLSRIVALTRIAIDTEADSLHCYREKLCLLQLSIPGSDFVLDPLALRDLSSLAGILKEKEIVLHGADFDLRLLRRGLGLVPAAVFDTVIAARLLGQRQFSLAALVQRYFNVELPKGSQKANWARRPLPKRMLAYAVNDTHYLLELSRRMEDELIAIGRLEWFRQSCQRAIEQAAMDRTREPDEVWRISGSGALRGRAAAILRELWHWREKEAEAVDRPVFHILQNEELLRSAASFYAGETPDYHHFSTRRRGTFMAAAQRGMELPEADWPMTRRRLGTRRSPEANARVEELRRRRDDAAAKLELEPAFVAPRAALEAIAVDESAVTTFLVPWQRELLGLGAERSAF